MPASGDSTGFPPRIRPMLAVPTGELPEPETLWAAEFKWDGVRAVAYLSAGRLRLLSRGDRDMTRSYPELADLAHQAGTGDMVLDGEIAAFDGGRPSFAALQRRMHVGAPSARLVTAVPVTYLVFDIMYAGAQPLISEPYAERRAILEAQPLAGPHVHVPPSFPGGGQAVLAVSVRDGLEGVVVKRLDSPYQPGRRSPAWLKIKNRRLLDVVVGGISPGRGHRAGRIGSLLVGIPAGPGLVYAGRVGTGFTQPELRALEGLLTPLRRDSPPFSGPVPLPQARDVTWVEPRLVIEVSYAERTADGILRAAAYQGLKATGGEDGTGPLTASGPVGPARRCRPPRDRARRCHLPRSRGRRCRLPRGRGRPCRPLPGRVRHCRRSRSRARRHPARARPRSWDRVPYRPPLRSFAPAVPGNGPPDTTLDRRPGQGPPTP
ncbi:MAG TPA: non-homologous end-joining DNA ligase [Streptosporangiaceae bacterium]